MTGRCVQEPHVRRAAANNEWTPALCDHVATCADCAAAAAAAPFMHRLASIDERSQKLPDASVLWLKAHLFSGGAVTERASSPLNVVQMIAYVVVAAGWAGVLTWKWADLQRWILGFTPTRLAQNVAQATPLSVAFLGTVAVLASLTVMVALHTILAED
ncbi:MAG TPA: hypothetical protein VF980_05015 [Thermoanaerobaculia bacterium]